MEYWVREKLPVHSLIFSFLPSWWNRNYGIIFGEKYIFDADYRVNTFREMERLIYERFPGMGIGCSDPEFHLIPPEFSNTLVTAAAGCEVFYPEDNYPWSKHLDFDKIISLKVPEDLEKVFPYSEIISQMNYLNKKYDGSSIAYFPMRGVINDAYLIGGEDFFIEQYNESEVAKNIAEYSCGMYEKSLDYNCSKLGFGKDPNTLVAVYNCAAAVTGPNFYENYIFEYDKRLAERIKSYNIGFAVHHCGVIDNFIGIYKKLGDIKYLEVGWGSDIERVFRSCGEAVMIRYYIGPSFLIQATRKQVRDKVAEILEKTRGYWDKLLLCVSDIDCNIPDENILEIYESCKSLGGIYANA